MLEEAGGMNFGRWGEEACCCYCRKRIQTCEEKSESCQTERSGKVSEKGLAADHRILPELVPGYGGSKDRKLRGTDMMLLPKPQSAGN